MSVKHHALERSLSSLTVGMVKHLRDKENASAHMRLVEREQQFQIPIAGTAYQGIAWTKRRLYFDVHFFGSKGQRDSPYDHPQVTYGFVIDPRDSKEGVLPIVPTLAIEWIADEKEATTGAIAHIGVHNPSFEAVEFSGYLHVTFQGWGAPTEDETEPEGRM